MNEVSLWKSFEQTDLFLESLKKRIGELCTAMLLIPKLSVTWIGDQTLKMETEKFIQRAIEGQREQPRKNYELAIVLKDDRGLIGGCGIHVSDPTNREGWIGYCLSRHHWRQGYATEAAKALLRFGFDQLNLHRIFALFNPENLASAHVLKKVGMQQEGHLRERRFRKGKWHDELLYAIIDNK